MKITQMGIIIAFCSILTAGCASLSTSGKNFEPRKKTPVCMAGIMEANQQAGMELLTQLDERHPYDLPLLLTTFVNLDNLEETSSLGRIIPQQMGTGLTRHGYQVVDVRLRKDTLLVSENRGELALSRRIEEIAGDEQTYSVLTGTYSVAYGQVFVNAKVLRSSDKVTLAAVDYALPLDLSALDPAGFSGADLDRPRLTPNVQTSLN